MKKKVLILSLLVVAMIPVIALAVGGLGDVTPPPTQRTAPSQIVNCLGIESCHWTELFGRNGLVHNVIYFALFALALPIAVIALVWAGILMVTKPAVPDTREKAKKIVWSVVIGLILALAGYLIIQAIITGLGGSLDLQNVF